MMHDFLSAFLGGLLLGVSVVGYLYIHGQIAGISGLIGQVLNLKAFSRRQLCGFYWVSSSFHLLMDDVYNLKSN